MRRPECLSNLRMLQAGHFLLKMYVMFAVSDWK